RVWLRNGPASVQFECPREHIQGPSQALLLRQRVRGASSSCVWIRSLSPLSARGWGDGSARRFTGRALWVHGLRRRRRAGREVPRGNAGSGAGVKRVAGGVEGALRSAAGGA